MGQLMMNHMAEFFPGTGIRNNRAVLEKFGESPRAFSYIAGGNIGLREIVMRIIGYDIQPVAFR